MKDRKLKKKKSDMPMTMVWSKDYERMIELFHDVDELLSKMNWNPVAKNINDIKRRVEEILDNHEGYKLK